MNKVKELVVTPILVVEGISNKLRQSGVVPVVTLWAGGVVTGILLVGLVK